MLSALRRWLSRWRVADEDLRRASEEHTCAAKRVQDVAQDLGDKSKQDRDKILEHALDDTLRALERKPGE